MAKLNSMCGVLLNKPAAETNPPVVACTKNGSVGSNGSVRGDTFNYFGLTILDVCDKGKWNQIEQPCSTSKSGSRVGSWRARSFEVGENRESIYYSSNTSPTPPHHNLKTVELRAHTRLWRHIQL